ncbi:hypothetical protein JCGZ_13830 [Jatropha curcas]|uniref:Uncharacterized protein n=1 Tax=Jatropha curcas TaxID=180498 RepID=A0A067KB71_JATCU|nr:hypothetical protein JCGZ_13830 [Jatropha curcas]
MGSSGDEDVHMLHDQFGDEHTRDMYLGVGEAKGRKENIRIIDVPSDIDEGELLNVCFTYNLSPECKLIWPLKGMRVTELLDEDSIMIQLHPNGLRLLCGLIELAHQDGYNVMARAVQGLYHFSVRLMKDHCFLQAKNNCNNRWSKDPLRQLPALPTPYD